MLYLGRYKELDGPDSIKLGVSQKIFDRLKGGDQVDRMQWKYLIPMPSIVRMNAMETALKTFAKNQGILAKKYEYISPEKLAVRLGSTETESWTAEKGMDAMMGILSGSLTRDSVIQVEQLEEQEIANAYAYANPVEPSPGQQEERMVPYKGMNFEIKPKGQKYEDGFKELPFFGELESQFQKILEETMKEKEPSKTVGLEMKRIDSEMIKI
jgi:hypothetical protein